ncbi:MAG TPA: helix-turn-helix transcriptional regulator [Cyclobacteriaceae bacterium]
MDVSEQFKSIASLIGEPVRATMLWNLLDGKAFTATELAIQADVSPQSASMHLNKLVQADLLTVESQGRHRYYRFSKPEVAYVIEAMINLLPEDKIKSKLAENARATSGIKYCRTCYDHLAGKIGVAVTDELLKQKFIRVNGKEYDVTTTGVKWFSDLGIQISDLKTERRVFARQCLDWSERRHHLAGTLGAALLNQILILGWIRKVKDSREVTVTAKGQTGLYKMLKLSI